MKKTLLISAVLGIYVLLCGCPYYSTTSLTSDASIPNVQLIDQWNGNLNNLKPVTIEFSPSPQLQNVYDLYICDNYANPTYDIDLSCIFSTISISKKNYII